MTVGILSFGTTNYTYLWAVFQANPVPTQALFLLQGNDGKAWVSRTSSYNGPNAVRDPSIKYINGKFWLAHTNIAAFNQFTKSFDIGFSTDAHEFIYLKTIDCTNATITGANAEVGGPEWFVDSDGTVGIIFTASPNSWVVDTAFQLYWTKPVDQANFSGAWTTPVVITGTGLPNNMIDPFLVKIGSTYYHWYKNENTKLIEMMSSTSLLSGYSLVKTGDHAGWGSGVEGTCLISLGGNNWRMYLDAQGGGISYSDSTDNWATWSARVLVTAPFVPQHGTVIVFAPGFGG